MFHWIIKIGITSSSSTTSSLTVNKQIVIKLSVYNISSIIQMLYSTHVGPRTNENPGLLVPGDGAPSDLVLWKVAGFEPVWNRTEVPPPPPPPEGSDNPLSNYQIDNNNRLIFNQNAINKQFTPTCKKSNPPPTSKVASEALSDPGPLPAFWDSCTSSIKPPLHIGHVKSC